MRLAIITTHPIQYYAPVFQLLTERNIIDIKVYYTLGRPRVWDNGFSKTIDWDIPLLDNYAYEWVQNTAANPGSNHFNGIVNPDLIDQVNRWNPHAILIYGWAYHGHLKALRYFKNKIPVYFRGDSTLLNDQGLIKGVARRIFLKWVYRHVDHAFYVGTNNKLYFRYHGLKEQQLSFAPHAIDIRRFAADHSAEAHKIRQSLNIKEDDICIIYAGKFEYVKNLSLLIAAFKNLDKPNVHLLLVGNGAEEEKLKKEATGNKNGQIHFLDFVNQSRIPAIYQAADIICLPSLSETWGLMINEAMACGKAVLVSDKVGCAADLVKDDHNGLVFNYNQINDLTDCLAKLTRSKTMLRNYGKNSFDLISDWNFEKVAESIENKLLTECK